MKRITDKIPLLICCALLFYHTGSPSLPVMVILSAISVSSLSQAARYRITIYTVQLTYIAVCLFVPQFWYCFPVVFYDIMYRKGYLFGIISGVCFLLSVSELSAFHAVSVSALAAVAFVMQKHTRELESVSEKLIQTRDTSAELNMTLSDKNRQLIENQDYEIHLATLKERNRIAREIHDNVGHLLSRSIIQAGAVRCIEDGKLRNESLDSLSETLNNAMDTIRKSVHDLHDDSIDLKQSLGEIISALDAKGIAVSSEIETAPEMPNDVKLCIIGVVKEAVSNILKHSDCDRVSIYLIEHPAFRQLKIHDNGRCSENIRNSGIGLLNMRERVEKLGGIITFTSDRNGFGIVVSLKKEG